MFLGDRGSSIYIFTLGLYMYGTLWAYTSVFANACSEALPIASVLNLGHDDYLLYVALFSSVVVPLTCMELKEQVTVQVILSLCRLVMVVIIVGSTAAAMNSSTPQVSRVCGSDRARALRSGGWRVGIGSEPNLLTFTSPLTLLQFDDQTCAHGTAWVNWSGLYKMLPIAIYANIFHHSIPGLSKPVADKGGLSFVFGMTFAFGMVAYGLIGEQRVGRDVVAWGVGRSRAWWGQAIEHTQLTSPQPNS